MQIYVNVYDLTDNKWQHRAHTVGLGVYHSGLEVGHHEWSFGASPHSSSGIFSTRPRAGAEVGLQLRESVHLGQTDKSQSEIEQTIHSLSGQWAGNSYHLLRKNCNHFSEALCMILLGRSIPGWINRLSGVGRFFGACLPVDRLVMSALGEEGAPPEAELAVDWRDSPGQRLDDLDHDFDESSVDLAAMDQEELRRKRLVKLLGEPQ